MMGINPWLVPVWLLTVGLFFLGRKWSGVAGNRVLWLLVGLLAAVPGVLFVIYYTGILGEAEWFYRFRSWPGTELTAAGAGLLAGLVESWRARTSWLKKYTSAAFVPFMVLLLVTIPYLKQIFLRPDWNAFQDKWMEGVCLQSSESSCGPASAATLLRLAGVMATEREIARESYTTRRGTENWYLIRTMRRLGLPVDYRIQAADVSALPYPAIVGVRMNGSIGPGHFIVVLGKSGDKYIMGDPMRGREEVEAKELLHRYYFTGFSMVAEIPKAGNIVSSTRAQ